MEIRKNTRSFFIIGSEKNIRLVSIFCIQNDFLEQKIPDFEGQKVIKKLCKHYNTKQNDLRDLLKLFIHYEKDYMTHSCGNGKYGILKFIRSGPTTFWDLSETYKMKDEYFKIVCDYSITDQMKMDCLINYCIYSGNYEYTTDVKKRYSRESHRQLAPNVVITNKLFHEIYDHTDNSGYIHCFVSIKDFIKIFNPTSTQTINVGHSERITSNIDDQLKMTQKGDNLWCFNVKSEKEISEFKDEKKLVEEHKYLRLQLQKVFQNDSLIYVQCLREILLDENNDLKNLDELIITQEFIKTNMRKTEWKNVWNSFSTKYNPTNTNSYPQLFVKSDNGNYIINPSHTKCIQEMFKRNLVG